jgi:hypothetical protein
MHIFLKEEKYIYIKKKKPGGTRPDKKYPHIGSNFFNVIRANNLSFILLVKKNKK